MFRSSIPKAALVSLLALGGCDAESEDDYAERSQSITSEQEGPPRHHGISPRVVHAADKAIGLDDDQAAEAKTLLDGLGDARESVEAFHQAVAAEVATCTLDAASVVDARAALIDAIGVAAASDAAVLDALFVLLDAEQRDAAVEEILSRPMHPPHGRGGPGKDFAEKLQLSDAQVETLQPLQRTPPSADGELDDLLEAFASDSFIAADWGMEAMAQEQATSRTDGMLAAVSELCPTLDEGQRSTLAELLVSPPPRPEKHERRRG